MFACLLLCFISMLASLDLGFAICALCPPWVCAWVVRSVPSRVCLDVTTYEIHLCGVGVLTLHLSLPCAMLIRLPCLLCTTRLAFFASLHTCLHVHAWVCVSSILQSNEAMDTRSKTTFVLLGHLFLFDDMLVCLLCMLSMLCLLPFGFLW